jgi:uncharacterized protein (TIGR02996 family)
VTTEDDFQKALDANPDDFQTKLVFADWLQERGDERAEGYRALGVQRLYPFQVKMAVGPWKNQTAWMFGTPSSSECPKAQQLPPDWFKKVARSEASDNWWCRFPSRRACEDAVAWAFSQLPAERRTELLAGPKPARKRAGRTTKRRKSQRKK